VTPFPTIEPIFRPALAFLLALSAAACSPMCWAQEVRLLVQRSPLAGFRYHEAPRLLEELCPGEPLELLREPDNPYDRNAVRVEWQGHKLGYVPRRRNAALAWAMDAGQDFSARIAEPPRRRGGRRRVDFDIYVD
jgi:hypothetical protein